MLGLSRYKFFDKVGSMIVGLIVECLIVVNNEELIEVGSEDINSVGVTFGLQLPRPFFGVGLKSDSIIFSI